MTGMLCVVRLNVAMTGVVVPVKVPTDCTIAFAGSTFLLSKLAVVVIGKLASLRRKKIFERASLARVSPVLTAAKYRPIKAVAFV